MIVGRFLLRLLLVPLGWCFAVAVAVAAIAIANRGAFAALAHADVEQQQDWLIVFANAAPEIVTAFGLSALWMMGFAAIGVLIAETFAIRSWIYHAANGGVSAWLGWHMMGTLGDNYRFLAEPKVIVAAGLAGGLAYWLVAGWSAGFWKPVFAPEPAADRA